MPKIIPESQSKLEAIRLKNLPAVVAAGCVAVAAWKTGLGSEVFDQQISPGAPYTDQIVDGMVLVNESLRTLGPAVMAYGLAETARHKISAKKSGEGSQAALTEFLSQQELTPGYTGQDLKVPAGILDRTKQLFKGPRRASAIVASTLAFCGISAGLEHEISNGPERPQNALLEVLAPHTKERTVLLQDKKITFMDDSAIPKAALDVFADKLGSQGVAVVPFKKELFNINGTSSLVLSIPDTLYAQYSGKSTDDNCKEASAIVDSSVAENVGEVVDINGNAIIVARKIDGVAQMNRSIAIMSDSMLRDCITHVSDQSYFGAVITGANPEKTMELLKSSGLITNATAITQQEFKANNQEFWRKNGTPVLLITMGLATGLGTVALVGKRRTALQNSEATLATMRALGAETDMFYDIEERRALREANKALLVTVGMVGLAGVFNAAEKGLQVGIGIREVGVGYTLALSAQLLAGRRAVKAKEDMNITKAMRS